MNLGIPWKYWPEKNFQAIEAVSARSARCGARVGLKPNAPWV